MAAPTPSVHPLYLLEQAWDRSLSRPFLAALERLGVRPNAVTAAAFVIKLAAAWPMALGRYELAGGLWVLGAVADALDGGLARRLGRETRLGAYLDTMGDRAAAGILVAAFAAGQGPPLAYPVALALVALSLLHALAKAQAEALGGAAEVRALHRSGRSVWLSVSLLLGPSIAAALGHPAGDAVLLAFGALAGVTAVALLLRVVRAAGTLRT